ncbi:MAG: hypothetical protein LAT76_00435 [Schleiferiaceae bacterium]|nr:hypothetical protein [Schleiferiaceae bacterium]
MKKTVLLVLVAAFLIAAKGDSTFSGHGLSFLVPKGWKIKSVKDFGTHQIIDVRKRGLSSSGLVVITVFHEAMDAEAVLYEMLSSFGEVALYKNFTYTETLPMAYGSHDAVAALFGMTVFTVPHTGVIYAFQKNDKTLCIVQQEADEDTEKNAAGFKAIQERFEVAVGDKRI